MNDAELEAARGELRQAAVDYAGLIGTEYDEDAFVNQVTRLEVAAQKFVEAKSKS